MNTGPEILIKDVLGTLGTRFDYSYAKDTNSTLNRDTITDSFDKKTDGGVPAVPKSSALSGNVSEGCDQAGYEFEERVAIMVYDGGIKKETAIRHATADRYRAKVQHMDEVMQRAVDAVVRHFVLLESDILP